MKRFRSPLNLKPHRSLIDPLQQPFKVYSLIKGVWESLGNPEVKQRGLNRWWNQLPIALNPKPLNPIALNPKP